MASSPQVLRAAVVQAEVAPDLAAGLVRTAELTREAAAAGARLIVFPETWLPGYPAWLDVCRDVALWDHAPVKTVYARMAAESVAVPGQACAALGDAARAARATLVVGVVERVDAGPGTGTLYNTILTFGPDGALRNHHRKLVPTYTERLLWGPGDADGLRAVDVGGAPEDHGGSRWRLGALVCWEHWMPLARQALHEAGEDVHAALWPTVHEMHQVASRQYAFEGRCYVLAAGSLMRAAALPAELEPHPGRVTDPDQWVLRGGSAVIGPDGCYAVQPLYDAPGILMADLDLARVREERMTLDVSGHYSRPDALGLVVRRTGRAVDDDVMASVPSAPSASTKS
jgi:predicted amidohydrolase